MSKLSSTTTTRTLLSNIITGGCNGDSPTKTSTTSSPESTKQQHHQQQISERDLIVFKAQLCEQSQRFEDMVGAMKELCQFHQDLTEDERNLLSCAYKNVIGFRRSSWKVVKEILELSLSSNNNNNNNVTSDVVDFNSSSSSSSSKTANPTVIKPLLSQIERELKGHCNDIIKILNTRLLNSSSATGESRVFYYKMKGDYTRYLCETCTGNERKEKANESLLAYKTASDKALIDLPPTHPVRLGLMLNFSVFYYEIMRSPERSCRLAKQAFDDAIAELDTLSEESYLDSTIIMQLLRDNLNYWESEQPGASSPTNNNDQQPNAIQQQQQANKPS